MRVMMIKTHLPVHFWCGDLWRLGDDLLPAATSIIFLREVLAFLSRSTMNFFVFGWPAGDSSLYRLRQLSMTGCRCRGDLSISAGMLATSGDLITTFGDLFVTFGDLENPVNLLLTSGDLWLTSDVLLRESSCETSVSPLSDVPFTARCGLRSGERCTAIVEACVIGCSLSCISDVGDLKSHDMLLLPFTAPGLNTYRSLLAADDGTRLPGVDFGLWNLPNRLADDDVRLILLAGDGFWGVNFSCSLFAVSTCVLSGVSLCNKHPSESCKLTLTVDAICMTKKKLWAYNINHSKRGY